MMINDITVDSGLLRRFEDIPNYDMIREVVYKYVCSIRDGKIVGYLSTENFMRFMENAKFTGTGFEVYVNDDGSWSLEFNWGRIYFIDPDNLYREYSYGMSIIFFTDGGIKIYSRKRGTSDKVYNYRNIGFNDIFELVDKTIPKTVITLHMPG